MAKKKFSNDVNQRAKAMGDIGTGQSEDKPNPPVMK
jgi:hypothetical protein